jgi:hypothetical protein
VEIMCEAGAIYTSGKVIATSGAGQGIREPNDTAGRTGHLWLGNPERAALEYRRHRRITGNATHAWAIHDAFARASATSIEADFARRHTA